MGVIKCVVFVSLIISYGHLLINLIRGSYKNNMRNLCIDVFISYYFAPLLVIGLIWDFVEKKKNRKLFE